MLKTVLSLVLILGDVYCINKCQPRKYEMKQSIVCVCNGTYCDLNPTPTKVDSKNFLVFTSNQAGLRFEQTSGKFVSADLYINAVQVDRERTFQTVLGFGGAFTDSAGINIAALKDKTKDNLINSYFSSEGIGYNLGRVPIGSTDCSTRFYSYDDTEEPDPQLTKFLLPEEDLKYKIPYMQKALNVRNGDVKFFGAAWAAPLWMKTDHAYNKFLGMIKETFFESWSHYHLKFLQAYETYGIKMFSLSTGNEPLFALSAKAINGTRIAWTPDLQTTWLGSYFGPLLRASYPKLKIAILDDQRFFLPWYGSFLINDVTNKYVDYIAVHSYADDEFSPMLLAQTKRAWPNVDIVSTEYSIAGKYSAVDLGSWDRAEKYSFDIMQDFLFGVTAWIDWNLALDVNGGPNFENNFLDAAIIVNATSDEFYKQPAFYHLGHFSKFVPENSVRIFTRKDCVDGVYMVGFKKPDDGIVVIILNRNTKSVPLSIIDGKNGIIKLDVLQKSITTVLYW